jgi:hypothetical protein
VLACFLLRAKGEAEGSVTYPSPWRGVAHTVVVDTVPVMGKSFLWDASVLLFLMTLGMSSVTDIEEEPCSGEAEVRPRLRPSLVLRFDGMCHSRWSGLPWDSRGRK